MDKFTVQKENSARYETYEWDNVWLEHADEPDRKRVLYIGDSISCGTRLIATAQTEKKILFDGFGTSKALDNPWFKDALHLFAVQQGQRSAVLFNNGLHGFHLDDETAYRNYYEDMVRFLLEEFNSTPLYIVLTTHIADPAQNRRVILRNQAARKIAETYDLPVIDLYAVTEAIPDQLTDGVHLTETGYKALAREIIETLKNI